MTTIHNLGFPRIGARRELKFALESYWKANPRARRCKAGRRLRQRHWQQQAGLDWCRWATSRSTTRCWT
jgi:5-methyltetrahydropteroyltriglutamate--homocysteine methyltransferase